MEESKLSKWQLASYGAPAMPLAMNGLILATYLPAVYADAEGFGLALGAMGFIVMLSRIFDGVTDPIVGYWSDRITTRWGRRKPFIVIGLPIWAVSYTHLTLPTKRIV